MSASFPHSPYDPPQGTLPYAGIATFAGYPCWQAGQRTDAVILGIPYDEGTTYRPGTRLGPRSIRQASMYYAYEAEADRFYDTDRRQWILRGKSVADAGDVAIEPLSLESNWAEITRCIRTIVEAGALPAVLGGDHSVTYPVVKGFAGRPLHYVHLDTHADCDRIFKSGFSHGSPVARIQGDGLAQSITLVGLRGLSSSSGHDLTWFLNQSGRIVTARELRRAAGRIPFPPGEYYVSVDIDFFDPAAAPATGTPEPGGLFFPDFSDLVAAIAAQGRIVGFDIVEVNPLLEGHHAITSHLAARCVLELLSAALDDRKGMEAEEEQAVSV